MSCQTKNNITIRKTMGKTSTLNGKANHFIKEIQSLDPLYSIRPIQLFAFVYPLQHCISSYYYNKTIVIYKYILHFFLDYAKGDPSFSKYPRCAFKGRCVVCVVGGWNFIIIPTIGCSLLQMPLKPMANTLNNQEIDPPVSDALSRLAKLIFLPALPTRPPQNKIYFFILPRHTHPTHPFSVYVVVANPSASQKRAVASSQIGKPWMWLVRS